MLVAAAALPLAAAAGPTEDFEIGLALARDKGCLECHALGYRDVGPSFREIARRYRLDALHRQELPRIIRGGSIGHWGERYAMWPQPALSDEELRTLVDWIVSQ